MQAEIAELVGDDELLNRELLQQLQAGGNPVVPWCYPRGDLVVPSL